MNSICIHGTETLHGEVKVQGSKNAVLPIMAACVLTKETCVLRKCPKITDVFYMSKLLQSIGCKVAWESEDLYIDSREVINDRLPAEYVRQMRSSVVLMGALLGRCGSAVMDYPGGCVIGERPIDLHLKGLQRLGVCFEVSDTCLCAVATKLCGNEVKLRFPSVGATENLILAAVMAEGETVIQNPAREPEISALCAFLRKAGALIREDVHNRICIVGKRPLHGVAFTVPGDRIVAGTYLLACAAVGGRVTLHNAPNEQMSALFEVLRKLKCHLELEKDAVRIEVKRKLCGDVCLTTAVYPGFPTDLQSQLLTVLSLANGRSCVQESLFEDRFRVIPELKAMGADIVQEKDKAYINGVERLYGRQVVCEELRGGAALVIAGVAAEGITVVNNTHYIDRGYVDICGDFRSMGANMNEEGRQE